MKGVINVDCVLSSVAIDETYAIYTVVNLIYLLFLVGLKNHMFIFMFGAFQIVYAAFPLKAAAQRKYKILQKINMRRANANTAALVKYCL